MGKEYEIKFAVPADFDLYRLAERLPSPIKHPEMLEIYNFAIRPYGFYFIDQLVDARVASLAFRMFVDEALAHAPSVEIIES